MARDLPQAFDELNGRGRTPEGRAFWVLFAVGWLGWVGIMAVSAALGEEPVLPAVASTVGPIVLAVGVARWRRVLLQPDAPLLRTVVAHVGYGFLYALGSALISAILVRLIVEPGDTFWNDPLVALVPYLTVVHLILYVVLAGFLMWTESIRQVHESHARLAHEAALRAEAEAKALRAQFNPHFVLNTLHSLMVLVREEPETAERAIEDVGELIRYAACLERCDRDTVPLGEEIEIAKRYLGLERLRLGNRLEVSWEITSEPEPYCVPSFSLQSLLENAIKHGLSPRPEGGTVQIRIGVEDRHLVLSVTDDGMGAEPGAVMGGEGRGLGLLARRLSALYGRGASLTWNTAPGQGFSAEVVIPLSNAVGEVPGRSSACEVPPFPATTDGDRS